MAIASRSILSLAVLLASGFLALAEPAPPAPPPPAAYPVAEHRPYPAVVKSGETVVYDPALVPKGIAGVGLTGDQITRAINRGRDYLWPILKKRAAAPAWIPSGPDLLITLALLHAGAQTTYPEFDALSRRLVASLNPDQLGTYEIPLAIMMAEQVSGDFAGPDGAKMRDGFVRPLAKHVIESQGVLGAFPYNWSRDRSLRLAGWPGPAAVPDPGEVLRRTTVPKKIDDGDNSTTQYAAIALWRAARAGLALDTAIWTRCRQETANREVPGGGWMYTKPGKDPVAYGSMTLAGICTIALCRIHENAEPFEDPSIQRGLAWMVANFTVSENPGLKKHLYYYLYGLERVGGILCVEFIGDREWYPLGARFLIDAQAAEGFWFRNDREQDTAFALLFLTRATGSPVRPGRLLTTAPEYVLLDGQGREVARGLLGDGRSVPAGEYTLRVTIGDVTFTKAITVPEGGTVTVTPADLAR